MSNMLSAIITVLDKYSNWLNYRSITQEIINDSIYIFGWATPELSVNTTINNHIKKKWEKSDIVYLWNGTYIMRKYYNSINRAKEKSVDNIDEIKEKTVSSKSENINDICINKLDFTKINNVKNDALKIPIREITIANNHSGFVWKWWEFAVCAELLFRDFNATIMPVDSWADIVAIKRNELFNIQVKTSNIWSDFAYRFFIKSNSLQRYNFMNMYYVFVMIKTDGSREYIIIPYYNIQWMIWAWQINTWNDWHTM